MIDIHAKTAKDAGPRIRDIGPLKAELEHLAFHGHNAAVAARYNAIPEHDRPAYQSTHVLNAVVRDGLQRLQKAESLAQLDRSLVFEGERACIEKDLDRFIQFCSSRRVLPRELFENILRYSGILTSASDMERALGFLEHAEERGIRTYPELHAQLKLDRAELLFHTGRIPEAHGILSDLSARHYAIPDKNLIAAALLALSRTSLLTGRARDLKALLCGGLRQFYTRDTTRRLFTFTMKTIYRSSFRAFLDMEITLSDKMLFLAHLIDHSVHRKSLFRKVGLDRLTRLAVLASVYFMNYVYWQGRSSALVSLPGAADRPAGAVAVGRDDLRDTGRTILVTRAMGGIGDLLMMTPGLHALKQKYPDHDIHLAIPRRYHELFQGNRDVQLLDIEGEVLDVGSYRRWFNLTDCPAARQESRTAPNVVKSRIDLFAHAQGIKGRRLRGMDRRPRYFLTEEESQFQRSFRAERGLEGKTVVGIQLQAAEPYRDYPLMADLVAKLATEVTVVLFHGEKTAIPSGGSVIDPGALPLRRAFALAAACDGIIAPDSAFVHFAAAFDIPCVALYGPIDGVVRTKHYPACVFVDARSDLRCIPCWRSERIPCALTDMRNSACMGNITVTDIVAALRRVLEEKGI